MTEISHVGGNAIENGDFWEMLRINKHDLRL